MTAGRAGGWRRRIVVRGALPLALGCLVIQLSAAAHFVLQPHSICPEHGEVVDAHGPTGAHVEAVTTQQAARAGSLAGNSRAEDLARHEHDHCLLASERRDSLGLPPARPLVDPSAPRPEPSPGVEHTRARTSLALLLVAPKSSPPPHAAV